MSVQISSRVSDISAGKQLNEEIKVVTFTGESGSGKNHRIAILQRAFPSMKLIRSVTTRKLRPGGQDSEYVHETHEDYQEMESAGKFIWTQHAHGNLYGTLQSDIDDATSSNVPSLMHVHHSKVGILQNYVQGKCRSQGVLSIFVYCGDRKVLKRRILKRDPNITEDELNFRLDGIEHNNSRHLSSGEYHLKFVSCDKKNDDRLLREMIPYLTATIPRRRTFTV